MFKLQTELPKNELKKNLLKMHPYELSEMFIYETFEHRKLLVNLLTVEVLVEVFLYLEADEQLELWNLLSLNQQKNLLTHLKTDDLKAFIESMDEEKQYQIIASTSKDVQQVLKTLLSYEKKYAGSILSTHFLLIDSTLSIKDATHYVTTESTDKDEIDMLYVVNEQKKYVGAISLQDLIIARPKDILFDLVDTSYPSVSDTDLVALVVKKIRDYDLSVIPVLNQASEVIGIITADDAFDYMESIHDDSYERLVSVLGHEASDKPWVRSYKRLPWLLASVVLNLVIAAVLSIFSPTLEAFVALVMFQPMILGMAGNIGTQSLAVTILGLHEQKIEPKKHIRRETMIGFINSLSIGIFGMIVVFAFLKLAPHIETDYEFKISIVVGLSLFSSMFLSALVGVFLPFLLRKIGADEKIAGGPIISTVNDFAALGLYFLIATLLLITFI